MSTFMKYTVCKIHNWPKKSIVNKICMSTYCQYIELLTLNLGASNLRLKNTQLKKYFRQLTFHDHIE